jgi:hypothetical protein
MDTSRRRKAMQNANFYKEVIIMENEIPKHKKKKQSSKSKSSKKAKHSHNYIPCILHANWIGKESDPYLKNGHYDTGKVCTICGKIKWESYDLWRDRTWVSVFHTEDEYRSKLSEFYPDIEIETIEVKWNGERIE